MLIICFNSAPSAPPNTVTVLIQATQITVQWKPPSASKQNGIIRRWDVLVTERTTGTTLQVSSNYENQTVTVSNLKPYTFYHVKVAAYTVGLGPFSSVVELRTLPDG